MRPEESGQVQATGRAGVGAFRRFVGFDAAAFAATLVAAALRAGGAMTHDTHAVE